MGSVVKHETPNYGVSAARGVACVGLYVQMAAAGEPGEWEHSARAKPAAGGSTSHTCVCVYGIPTHGPSSRSVRRGTG